MTQTTAGTPALAVTLGVLKETAPAEHPKTGMFFSDAKAGLAEIIAAVKTLVASRGDIRPAQR